MQYISLYRKYRPKNFDEVVGQDVIVEILKNSIINNQISHAYIFSGPRGTGKTSIAKIFAKAVNCQNNQNGNLCGKCEVCNSNQDELIDIVEIDAASNNGVDEIREIRNSVKLLPNNLKYKVYIIDEVHMLSTNAFNALLKTLEEPPNHVIFILATTEFNKIPQTVISRCQKFDFKKINKNLISKHLKKILNSENKKLDDDIIQFISEYCDGGLRDAINLLDQVLAIQKDNVTVDDIYELTGIIKNDVILNLLEYIVNSNIKETLNFIDNYFESGGNFQLLINKMLNILKDLLIYNSTTNYFDNNYEKKLNYFSKYDISLFVECTKILFDLNFELKRTLNHKMIVEIYFLRILLLFNSKKNSSDISNNIVNNSNEEIKTINNNIEEKSVDLLKNIKINNAFAEADRLIKNNFVEKYKEIKDYIYKKEFSSIASLMSKAVPEVVSKRTIIFKLKKDIDVKLFNININEIQNMLKSLYNVKFSIVGVTEEEWDSLKEEYISNLNNKEKYKYIDEIIPDIKKSNNTKLQNSIEGIFGDEYTNIE